MKNFLFLLMAPFAVISTPSQAFFIPSTSSTYGGEVCQFEIQRDNLTLSSGFVPRQDRIRALIEIEQSDGVSRFIYFKLDSEIVGESIILGDFIIDGIGVQEDHFRSATFIDPEMAFIPNAGQEFTVLMESPSDPGLGRVRFDGSARNGDHAHGQSDGVVLFQAYNYSDVDGELNPYRWFHEHLLDGGQVSIAVGLWPIEAGNLTIFRRFEVSGNGFSEILSVARDEIWQIKNDPTNSENCSPLEG
ncbi:hypothetical protein M3N55_12370 [Roseibaca sp. V10]|uniref:Uncharacterized protein n=1 Tax=Roseinatronobacter domitianus TaxID=2940293 RepID=A0ABT0M3U2_9RHOB|nr:hypothetical protein [Roseibaca domitiana]MCL1629527.1 hypothetical protein [Roseibaca domitiana]